MAKCNVVSWKEDELRYQPAWVQISASLLISV